MISELNRISAAMDSVIADMESRNAVYEALVQRDDQIKTLHSEAMARIAAEIERLKCK